MKLIDYKDAHPQNAEFELPPLIGCTITGYGYLRGDGEDFLCLRVIKNGEPITETGRELALIVSRDAELNGGGYLGWVDPDNWDRE